MKKRIAAAFLTIVLAIPFFSIQASAAPPPPAHPHVYNFLTSTDVHVSMLFWQCQIIRTTVRQCKHCGYRKKDVKYITHTHKY